MAKTPDPDAPAKKKSAPMNAVIWVLMAMLVLSLGGFGISNFGGRVTEIGRVGDRAITVNDYALALRSEINAFSAQVGQPVSIAQATALGLDAQVRQQLVGTAALDDEAARVGLSVGDAAVAREVTAVQAFQGPNGAFDRETYRLSLSRNNLTEVEFEGRIREDIARSLMQGAVAAGFSAPAPLTDTLYAYVAERRGFSLLTLAEADLPSPPPTPDEAALRAHYDANIARFTRPEARQITYVTLLPADVAAAMPADEETLRALYNERIDEYVQPERRLVERLVFPDDAAAANAKARLDAGEAFETLVIDRGVTLQDIDLGDVSQADLGEAGAAVFALAEPGIVGPLPSTLGPALFRMNGILAAQEVTFDDARADLATEAQADAARRAIADRRESIDDALAGGATLEDLAANEGMALGRIDLSPASDETIAGYPAFREAAAAAAEGDYPELIDLDDGGLAALRLEAILPPAPIPFDDARTDVEAGTRAEVLARALADRAVEIKAAVEGGASLGSYGILDVTVSMARDGFMEGVPETLIPAAFQMALGDVRVIEGPGFTGVLRLDRIDPAAAEGDAATALKSAIAAQAEQALSQDAFAIFTGALLARAPIRIDEAAIAAVHAQFQ